MTQHVPSPAPAQPAQKRESSLIPRTMAREVAVLLSFIVLISTVRATSSTDHPHATLAWVITIGFILTFSLSILRPLPEKLLIPFTLVWSLGASLLQAMLMETNGYFLIVVTMIVASRFSRLYGPVIAVLGGLGFTLATITIMRPFDFGGLLATALSVSFAYLAASSVRRLRDEKLKTERLLQEVMAGRDAQIRAAALDERAHIAREIHDILAHTLSALSVQLEGLRLLAAQRPGDPQIVAALERASTLTRNGLDEARRAVTTLRGDALPGPDELANLVHDFEHDTTIPCRFTVEGTPAPLPPNARLAVYRTAQEALTNVRKHAAATLVTMTLRYGMYETELIVENEGSVRSASLPGSGSGLNGMRERAALARGSLEAGPTATGFKVHLCLPI